MVRDLSNSCDVIDSRDIIARIEELAAELEAAHEDWEAEEAAEHRKDFPTWLAEATADEAHPHNDDAAELAALKALAEEAERYCEDWTYGAALIRESYWEDYCREMVEDIGDLPKGLPHYLVIDWDATAKNIAADYTEVEYDGVTYLVR